MKHFYTITDTYEVLSVTIPISGEVFKTKYIQNSYSTPRDAFRPVDGIVDLVDYVDKQPAVYSLHKSISHINGLLS